MSGYLSVARLFVKVLEYRADDVVGFGYGWPNKVSADVDMNECKPLYTVFQKKPCHFVIVHIFVTYWPNSFTATLCKQFAIPRLLNVPLYLNRVATLPREI